MYRLSVTLNFLLSYLICCFGEHKWNYNDASEWSDSFPYCAGTQQSPINIDTSSLNNNCGWNQQFDWTHITPPGLVTYNIFNDGHGLTITMVDPEYNQVPNMAVLKNSFVSASGEHREYCLDTINIHFGETANSGSEHLINNNGYAMEMQWIHYSCDYNSMEDALAAEPDDLYVLAIVSVFFECASDDNPFFHKIIDSMDDLMYYKDYIFIRTEAVFNNLIPPWPVRKDINYYYYKGSLNKPSCDEIVRWYVLDYTMEIGMSQLEALRELISIDGENTISPNLRPVQYNENDVYLCGNGYEKPNGNVDDMSSSYLASPSSSRSASSRSSGSKSKSKSKKRSGSRSSSSSGSSGSSSSSSSSSSVSDYSNRWNRAASGHISGVKNVDGMEPNTVGASIDYAQYTFYILIAVFVVNMIAVSFCLCFRSKGGATFK